MRLLWIIFIAVLAVSCNTQARLPVASDAPQRMLWAWEREEDLRFIDSNTTGVAFLAQTLTLENDEVRFTPRRQPLLVTENTYLTAVTRIETIRKAESRPTYSPEQTERIVQLVTNTLDRPNVRGIQIDFDAVVSERAFYRRLVDELRQKLPTGTPLTMTALASWCVGETWLDEMNVDEAIPMAFEMGADTERVRSYLKKGKDWTVPLCTNSYGLSVDEPSIEGIKPDRRIYYFKNSQWREEDLRTSEP